MKNKYEIRGDYTTILVERKNGEMFEFHIDTSDLPFLLELGYTWRVAKSGQKLYIRGTITRTESVFLHRLLLNAPRGMFVDHKDGDPFNNKRSNLRIVTQAENNRNVNRPRSKDKSLPVGVYPKKLKNGVIRFRAVIHAAPKAIYIGTYDTPEEAGQAYLQKREETYSL